jgi:hypothetical protein
MTEESEEEARMSEPEVERLRTAVSRLMDAQEEALDTVRQALDRSGEGLGTAETIVYDLRAALVDVLDILDGASADVQPLLGSDEEGD